jgi:predicted nucleotidyltransferase
MTTPKIPIPADRIADFCRRWKVTEFSLFGSVLRNDFRHDSDVDVLLTFSPEAQWSYWDFPDMETELQRLFGRPVDLVEKAALRNPFRRHAILTTRQVLYAA